MITSLLVACSQESGELKLTTITQVNSSMYPEEGTPSVGYSIDDILLPSQPGFAVFEQQGNVIDYSNDEYGYISVKATKSTQNQKVQVLFDDLIYTYDLVSDEYIIVPLQGGEGLYTIRILRNVDGTTYSILASTKLDVEMADENSTYLYPNQMVDYNAQTEAVLKSFELTENADSDLKRVYEVYHYITENIDYDYDKAELAKTTFILPIIDETYINQKGICFDYAALMSAMLRVQHIPTRIITGMTDVGYHAWVEVYLSDTGWINPSVYFESDTWNHVDPTFDSLGEYDGKYQEQDRY